MTGHGSDTRPTENLPTPIRTAIEQHLEERRQVGGRRRSAACSYAEFMYFRGIDPPMHGVGFGRRHSRCAIDAALSQLRRQYEITVAHSERFKQPQIGRASCRERV